MPNRGDNGNSEKNTNSDREPDYCEDSINQQEVDEPFEVSYYEYWMDWRHHVEEMIADYHLRTGIDPFEVSYSEEGVIG